MRAKIRGFGLVELVIVIAVCALALTAAYALLDYVSESWETKAGVRKGKDDSDAAYAKRDKKALEDATAAKDAALLRKAAAEKRVAELEAAASNDYQRGLTDGKKDLAAARARVAAGERLRDPGRKAECPAGSGGGTAPAAATATAGRDGAAGADLSDAASNFLLELASEADDAVKQLAAAQKVILACHAAYLDLAAHR